MVRFTGLGDSVTNEFCISRGLTEGRVVRSWQLNNFWTGEIQFWLCCESKNNKARYSSWLFNQTAGLMIMGTNCLVFKIPNFLKWRLVDSGPFSVISSLGIQYCKNIFLYLLMTVRDCDFFTFSTATNLQL